MGNTERKALFFDIDGTLAGMGGKVPESAREALRQAAKRGNLIFINTGRAYGTARDMEGQIEADGFLCGCGTEIIVRGESVYEYAIPKELAAELKKDGEFMNIDLCFEGHDGVTYSENPRIPETIRMAEFIREAGGLSGHAFYDDYRINKFCVQYDEKSDTDAFMKKYEKYFEIIDRGRDFYECIPLGHSKGTAVKYILERFDIPFENSYAFGDSMNDIPMLEAVSNAVIMGEHDREIEKYASFITKRTEDDGIFYAMKTLGII